MSTTDDIATNALALTEAMRSTTSDPRDAIRILTALIATPLPLQVQPSAAAAQALTAALFRRAALASIALACADYQPVSTTEAFAIVNSISALFDTEIVAAADGGQGSAYAALRDMRYAVINDLTTRSAGLPDIVTVANPGLLPSLVMAYRLYGDATREPGLTARATVVHPGFMPASFEALSA